MALLVSAENSISDEAYRADDVLTFRNGVTVEVTNTDAEGRLVLADGLCWACEKENPEYIVDIATLTGGVVVALGSVFAGMWCDDDDVRTKFDDAGELLEKALDKARGDEVLESPDPADTSWSARQADAFVNLVTGYLSGTENDKQNSDNYLVTILPREHC